MLIAVLQKLLPKTIQKVSSSLNGEISVIEQFGRRKIVVGKLTQSGPVMEEIWKEAMKYLKCHSRESGNLGFSRKTWIPDQSLPSTRSRVGDDNRELKILILGLGGGSIIKVLSKYFPEAKITAVDYDPIMVELGKKYLGLKKSKNLKIIIGDATIYVMRHAELISAYKMSSPRKRGSSIRQRPGFPIRTCPRPDRGSGMTKKILNQVQNDENFFDLIFVDLFSGDVIPKKTETEIFLRRIKEKLTKNGLVVFNRHYYQNHISEAKIFLDKLKKIFNDVSSKKILTNLLVFCRK